jgi:Family of unknown function (DUF6510)
MSDVSGESTGMFQLDGNAAAGLLEEIFAFDMTSAQCTCAGCGHIAAVGSLRLYGGQMGTVLRCPTCDRIQMHIVSVPGGERQYWIDMRGIALLRIKPEVARR